MQITWHLILIVASVLIGACLVQKGSIEPNMSTDQIKESVMYRNYGYLLIGVAVVATVYYYYMIDTRKATMCGYKANMCGYKATMCGRQ